MVSFVVLSAAAVAASLVTTKAHFLGVWSFETSQPGVVSLPASPGAGVAFPGFSSEPGSGTASGLLAGEAGYSSPAGIGSSLSFSSFLWAGGDYYQFEGCTLGFCSVLLSFDQF